MSRSQPFLISVTSALLLLAAVANPAVADSLSDCQSEDIDKILNGCTQVITEQRAGENILGLAYGRRAIARTARGQLDDAIKDFTASLPLLPSQSYDVLRSRGTVYSMLGRWDEAIKDLSDAIRTNPTSPMASSTLRARSIAYSRKKLLDLALSDLAEAIRLAPGDGENYLARAEIYRAQGQTDLAFADLNECITRDPSVAMCYSVRGALHGDRGQEAAALSDLDRAIALVPKGAPPGVPAQLHANRANVHLRQGEVDLAIDDWTNAIAFFAIPPYLVERGKLYLRKARFDLAIVDFGEAIRLAPLTRTRVASAPTGTRDPLMEEAYLNRGAAHQQTGDREAAIADFRMVLTFAPSHDGAIQHLKELGVAP